MSEKITMGEFSNLADILNNPLLKALNDIIFSNSWRYRDDRPDIADNVMYNAIYDVSPKDQLKILEAIYTALQMIANENPQNLQVYHSTNIFKYFVDDYAEALKLFHLD